jgi:AcrR family transcriptional regulator
MLFQRPKRVAILRAALELFANRGLERTSIAEITRCAGVTLDTFYKYFGSKEHLARVMYEDVERERDCYLDVLPPADASLQKQFLLLWCRMVDFAVQYPDAMQYLETYREGPAVPSIVAELVELLRRARINKGSTPSGAQRDRLGRLSAAVQAPPTRGFSILGGPCLFIGSMLSGCYFSATAR